MRALVSGSISVTSYVLAKSQIPPVPTQISPRNVFGMEMKGTEMTLLIGRDLPPLHADLEAKWLSEIEEICLRNRPSENPEDESD